MVSDDYVLLERKVPVILIVDDTPITLEIMAKILGKDGYQIETAMNGKRALDLAWKIYPDLVLLDVVMPEMNGYEVCRILNESPETKDIPVIFITVKNEMEDILKGFEVGAVDYVTKPFNAVELLARVRTQVELKRKRDNEKELICRLNATILERNRVEEELIRANDNLERLVKERTALLTRSNEQLMEEIEEHKRAEEALRESELKFRNLFDQATDGIMMMPIDGINFTVNKSFAKLHGYDSPKEMEHLTLSDIDTPETAKLAPERLRRLLAGESMNFEVGHYHKDGHSLSLEVSCNIMQIEGKSYFVGFHKDITDRKRVEHALQRAHDELRLRTIELEEANTALRVLLKRQMKDQKDLEERLQVNVNELVIPFIKTLRNCNPNDRGMSYLNILESNLKDIVSPFLSSLSSKYKKLTPKEIQIVGMIKDGMESKEIAEILGVAISTVSTHRENIRKKLGLLKGETNLRSYLISIS
jgi:PAS domain S-box-containing protein